MTEDRTLVATYDYTSAEGTLLYQVQRFAPKDFRQRRPDGSGGWISNLTRVEHVPYRLSEALAAVKASRILWIVEGEKDADALLALGHVATTNSGGAGKWTDAHSMWFPDADVHIIADADDPGRRHAQAVAASLRQVGAAVSIYEPAQGKDISDHLAANLDLDALIESGARRQRAVRPGGDWILDETPHIPAVWGQDDEVLWAEGEPFLLVGPPGVGKTTLIGQLVMARLGITHEVLGMPVAPSTDRCLYLASDRPRQIARSLRRMVSEADRGVLNDQLAVWEGPPPFDVAKAPEMLMQMAEAAKATTIVVDSLKDIALHLSDDEVGAVLNRALQLCVSADIEVVSLHHQRKGGGDRSQPKHLEDVYGSTWLTAGAGSVVCLWGSAGDLVVDFLHLKQPGSEVGPWRIEHDHVAGVSTRYKGFDALGWVRSHPKGTTATEAAVACFEKQTPTDNQRKKLKRTLDRLSVQEFVRCVSGQVTPDGHSGDRYYPIDILPIA